MNSGPLPSQNGGSWPVGFNGDPDGKIGASSSLLGNVQPYSYGGPARLSTQAAYLNIPHVVQRLVPAIVIPDSTRGMFQLNHQVDDGDVVFVIRCMFSPHELVSNKKKYKQQGVLFAIDPLVNLATVNYLLHGLQRYGFSKDADHKEWNTLWTALGIDEGLGGEFAENMANLHTLSIAGDELPTTDRTEYKTHFFVKYAYVELFREHRRKLVDYLVKNVIKPFGVPRGSEKQGGQHQVSSPPLAPW
jgi:hypothetical protein